MVISLWYCSECGVKKVFPFGSIQTVGAIVAQGRMSHYCPPKVRVNENPYKSSYSNVLSKSKVVYKPETHIKQLQLIHIWE